MEFRDLSSPATVDDVGVERVGRDVPVFDDAHGVPIAGGDRAVIATTGDADRTALLLASADFIWKRGGDCDVIDLRSGLVIPGAPGSAAVDGHQSALITDQENNVRVVGIDPEILIIVATGRATKSGPCLAAIGRAHGYRAGAVNDVCILRIHARYGEIPATDPPRRAGIVANFGPAFSGVIATIKGERTGVDANRRIAPP